MENFNTNKVETNKKEFFYQFKNKTKSFVIATGLALAAMMPSKVEAQIPKEKEITFVQNPDDPRLVAYKDSLYTYKKGQRNLARALRSLDEYSKQLHAPIQKDSNEDFSVVDEESNLSIHGDVSLHDHEYGDKEEYYDSRTKTMDFVKYEPYILRNIKPSTLMHLEAHIAKKDSGWNVESSHEFYPVFPAPVQEVRLDDSIKPIGKINIQGREIAYYSDQQLNQIVRELEAHGIKPTQVGESKDYTVSRFNETTKGWIDDELLGENDEIILSL